MPSVRGAAREITVPAFLLGMSCIGSQVALLRELLGQSSGNESVVALTLGFWMLLTGTGAHLAARIRGGPRSPDALATMIVALPILAIGLISVLVACTAAIGDPGTAVPLAYFIPLSFALLAPVCIPSGMLFVLLCRNEPEGRSAPAGARVYVWESLGTAVGGVAAAVLLLLFGSSWSVLLALACAESATAAVAIRMRVRTRVLLPGVTVVAAWIILFSGAESRLHALQYPGQQLREFRDTPYGTLTITGTSGQVNVFGNHQLLASSGDVIGAEEAAHYAMTQHPEPRRVLLIGGGLQGVIGEILKYTISGVDWVERDQAVIDLVTRAWPNGRMADVRVLCDDGRRFVQRVRSAYDVVLVVQPPPGSLQDNRYYTVEFFSEARLAMREGGVLAFGLLPDLDYYGAEARQLNASILAALRAVFGNAVIATGARNIFLASDHGLQLDVAAKIAARGIHTEFVNAYYLDDVAQRERAASLLRSLPAEADPNSDVNPVAFGKQVAFWFRERGLHVWVILAVIAAVSAVALRRLSVASMPMLGAGFAGSAGHMVVLLGFQIVFGSLFVMIGIMIGLFMAGLALGARFGARQAKARGTERGVAGTSVTAQIRLAAILLATAAPWIPGFSGLHDAAPFVLFSALNAAIAFHVGMLYSTGTVMASGRGMERAAELYSVDLAGSALGVTVSTLVMIPYLGMRATSVLLCGVMLASALATFLARNRFLDTANSEAWMS